MNNEVLWGMLMVINFAGVMLFYKLFKKTGLFIWIGISAILGNIQVLKTIELFGHISTLGNIIYATSFLATDILSENYGKKEATKGILVGFLTLITTTLMMYMCLLFIPHASDFANNALKTIFSVMPRITMASLIAYTVSQIHDTNAYEFWKKKTGKIFIANNLSTIISQMIDTILFTTIAFTGILPINVMIEIGITTYVFKIIVAISDTPFVYMSKKIK